MQAIVCNRMQCLCISGTENEANVGTDHLAPASSVTLQIILERILR